MLCEKHTINGKNNNLCIDSSQDLTLSLKINGDNSKIDIDKTVVNIEGDDHSICIKRGVRFNDKTSVFIRSRRCSLLIDEHSCLGGASFHLIEPSTNITIGKQCIISVQTNFLVSDYYIIIDMQTGLRINHAGNIKISDHVWIGIGVIVLKGVTIGKDSVIGAKSVVSKNIPSNVVTLGALPGCKGKYYPGLETALEVINSHYVKTREI